MEKTTLLVLIDKGECLKNGKHRSKIGLVPFLTEYDKCLAGAGAALNVLISHLFPCSMEHIFRDSIVMKKAENIEKLESVAPSLVRALINHVT